MGPNHPWNEVRPLFHQPRWSCSLWMMYMSARMLVVHFIIPLLSVYTCFLSAMAALTCCFLFLVDMIQIQPRSDKFSPRSHGCLFNQCVDTRARPPKFFLMRNYHSNFLSNQTVVLNNAYKKRLAGITAQPRGSSSKTIVKGLNPPKNHENRSGRSQPTPLEVL